MNIVRIGRSWRTKKGGADIPEIVNRIAPDGVCHRDVGEHSGIGYFASDGSGKICGVLGGVRQALLLRCAAG